MEYNLIIGPSPGTQETGLGSVTRTTTSDLGLDEGTKSSNTAFKI
jgi:hypothetical protein